MNKQADEKKKKISDLLLRTNGEFPREERDFIEYYFFEDLSEEEAAKKLNVSPEKFWRIFDSAVTKIRRAIPNIGNF